MNFYELCQTLNIDAESYTKEDFDILIDWCKTNISTDFDISDSEAKAYKNLCAAAKNYLDVFLPNAADNLAQAVKAFGGISTFDYALTKGYANYLESRAIPPAMVNTPNKYGMTPLHTAAIQGYVSIVDMLLKRQAKANVENNNLQLPIQCSLIVPIRHSQQLLDNKKHIFKILLNSYPDSLFHKDSAGNTIAHQLAAKGFGDILSNVLSRDMKAMKVANNNGVYPIQIAILNLKFSAVEALLKYDEALEQVDSKGRNFMHYAAYYGDRNILHFCIDRSPTLIHSKDNNHRTPLLLAVKAGKVEAAEALRQSGANVNDVDAAANTVLHYAVLSGNQSMVEWAKANCSASINTSNAAGQTPIDLCDIGGGASQEIKALLKSGTRSQHVV